MLKQQNIKEVKVNEIKNYLNLSLLVTRRLTRINPLK